MSSVRHNFIGIILLNVFLCDVILLEVSLVYANLSILQGCQAIGLQQLAWFCMFSMLRELLIKTLSYIGSLQRLHELQLC